MPLSWDDLKVALALSRAGSLTRAAELLGIDQSTAGRRLTALEAELGAVLFTRSKTGIVPTEAGEAAIARAIEIEVRIDRLTDDLARADEGPMGIVRLLGNAWTLELLSRKALAPFLSAHPRLDLRMIGSPPRTLSRGDATLSLWFETLPRESEFAIKLGDVPYCVYARRGLDPDAIGWVSYFDEDAPRLAPVRAFERLRKRGERLRLTANDSSVLRAAVVEGVGKGLLPVCVADAVPDLVRVGDGPPELMRALHLHAHPDTVQTSRIQATIRWLRESFAGVFAATP